MVPVTPAPQLAGPVTGGQVRAQLGLAGRLPGAVRAEPVQRVALGVGQHGDVADGPGLQDGRRGLRPGCRRPGKVQRPAGDGRDREHEGGRREQPAPPPAPPRHAARQPPWPRAPGPARAGIAGPHRRPAPAAQHRYRPSISRPSIGSGIARGRSLRGGLDRRPAQQGGQRRQPGQLGPAVGAGGQVPYHHHAVGRGDRAGQVHAQLRPDPGTRTCIIHMIAPPGRLGRRLALPGITAVPGRPVHALRRMARRWLPP